MTHEKTSGAMAPRTREHLWRCMLERRALTRAELEAAQVLYQGQRAHATDYPDCPRRPRGILEITRLWRPGQAPCVRHAQPPQTRSLRHQQDTTKMPWSPQPQIMARTKASHIRLPAEPATHRVVAGTLTNRRRMGQEARRLERTFGPQRFNHLRLSLIHI